jgi:hypothetical protein
MTCNLPANLHGRLAVGSSILLSTFDVHAPSGLTKLNCKIVFPIWHSLSHI